MSSVGAAPLVYLITDRHATGGRPLEEVIAGALEALALPRPRPRPRSRPRPLASLAASPDSELVVQLREKDLEGHALLQLARRLRALTAAAGARLFINDRVDVALAVGADGVHLGGGGLAVDDVRAIAPELQIALSTHRVSEVEHAAMDRRVSFVVFGPVFDTPSKRRFGPPLGLNLLRAAASSAVPVVAVGGVDQQKIVSCLAAGACGIACIRPILSNPDPKAALRGFFETIEST